MRIGDRIKYRSISLVRIILSDFNTLVMKFTSIYLKCPFWSAEIIETQANECV